MGRNSLREVAPQPDSEEPTIKQIMSSLFSRPRYNIQRTIAMISMGIAEALSSPDKRPPMSKYDTRTIAPQKAADAILNTLSEMSEAEAGKLIGKMEKFRNTIKKIRDSLVEMGSRI